MYKISVSPRAKKQLRKISKKIHKKSVSQAIDDLQFDPYSGKPLTKELAGNHTYKVEEYRIVYRIIKKDKKVEIITAGHRSSIYN